MRSHHQCKELTNLKFGTSPISSDLSLRNCLQIIVRATVLVRQMSVSVLQTEGIGSTFFTCLLKSAATTMGCRWGALRSGYPMYQWWRESTYEGQRKMDACSKALNRILVRREGRKLRWMGVMQESKNVSFWGMIVSAFIRNYLPSRATPLGDDLKTLIILERSRRKLSTKL